MNKKLWLPILFLFLILTAMPGALATDLYNTTQADLIYSDNVYGLVGLEPYSPRIYCDPLVNRCLLLVYENNALMTRGVKVIYSTNLFTDCEPYDTPTCDQVNTIPDDYSGEIGYRSYFNMPYDVVYNDDLGLFFVVSDNDIYTFNPITRTWATNRTITNTSCVGGHPEFLGILNDTTAYATCVYLSGNNEYTYRINLITGVQYRLGTPVIPATVGDLDDMRGMIYLIGSTLKNTYYFRDAGGDENTWTGNSIAYAGDYLGLHHFFSGDMYYPRTENVSAGVDDGMWSAATSDLASFASPVLVYALDDSIAETINESWSFNNGYKNILVWARGSNSTGDGIYIQSWDNKPIDVNSNYDASACLGGTCAYGTDLLIYTDNSTPTITFESDKTPAVSTQTFDFTDCDTPAISLVYEDTPYTYSVKALNSLTNLPVAGVNVTLGTESDTTDANGFAEFSVTPIDSAVFIQDNQGCHTWLYVNGTATNYKLKAEIANYNDHQEYVTPATKKTTYLGNTTAWDFVTNHTIYMDPVGVIVYAHIITQDNIEIYPASYKAYVSGNNGETWTTKGTFLVPRAYSNWESGTPVKFLLYDNRSSYNVTVTLDPPTGSNITHIETVTVNNQYDVYLQIPYALLEIPCSTTNDCSPSYCGADGFFNELSGCQGFCKYKQTDCITPALCDPSLGCYDVGTSDPCTSDLQCNNTCVGSYAMYLNKCGTDGFCKEIYKECKEACNVTVGICEESVDCVLGDTIKVGWELPYFYNDTSGNSGGDSFGGIVPHTCDIQNAGTNTCYHGDKIDVTDYQAYSGVNAIVTYPPGYPATADGTNLTFSDFVIKCSDSCGATLEICDYGCSDISDSCVGKPSGVSGSLTSILSKFGFGWIATIWWYILSLVVSLGVLILASRESGADGSVGWELFGATFIIMMVIGLVTPTISGVNMIFGVLLCILIGLGLAAKLSRQ